MLDPHSWVSCVAVTEVGDTEEEWVYDDCESVHECVKFIVIRFLGRDQRRVSLFFLNRKFSGST